MLNRSDIFNHPSRLPILKQQALVFLEVESAAPRIAGIFGTQQRYLLSQIAMAIMFRHPQRLLLLNQFLEATVATGVASRNTAHAFIHEMMKYGVVQPASQPNGDKRMRPLLVAEEPIKLIGVWLRIHLQTLDAFDHGTRASRLDADPRLLAAVHPRVVDGVMAAQSSVRPQGTFSLFTWMNDGGLVMDRMIGTIGDVSEGMDRYFTGITSFDDLAEPLRITKTHLSRTMAVAEKDGSVGWQGKRGASPLWLSPEFIAQYVAYQADKLAAIDAAFAEAVA